MATQAFKTNAVQALFGRKTSLQADREDVDNATEMDVAEWTDHMEKVYKTGANRIGAGDRSYQPSSQHTHGGINDFQWN